MHYTLTIYHQSEKKQNLLILNRSAVSHLPVALSSPTNCCCHPVSLVRRTLWHFAASKCLYICIQTKGTAYPERAATQQQRICVCFGLQKLLRMENTQNSNQASKTNHAQSFPIHPSIHPLPAITTWRRRHNVFPSSKQEMSNDATRRVPELNFVIFVVLH